MTDELEQMSPNQRRAVDKALAALETFAAIWAAEIRLGAMSARIAAVPSEAERAKRIEAMIEQGFIEGAYRHYLDHKDKCDELEAARATAEQIDELQAYSDWATDTRYSNSLECWQAACAWQRKAEARSDIPPVGYVTQDDLQRLKEGMGAIISPGNGVADIPLYESQQDAAIESKQAVQSAWHPIETAWKDREIWAFNGEQARMKWSEGTDWALWIWADELMSEVDPEPDQPTHWQPLPKPPADAAIDSQRSGKSNG